MGRVERRADLKGFWVFFPFVGWCYCETASTGPQALVAKPRSHIEFRLSVTVELRTTLTILSRSSPSDSELRFFCSTGATGHGCSGSAS